MNTRGRGCRATVASGDLEPGHGAQNRSMSVIGMFQQLCGCLAVPNGSMSAKLGA
jgi:hypothetical protein